MADPVSAIGMSSPPSNELLTVCVGEEWGGVGLQSIGSPVEVLVLAVPLLLEELDAAESLHMTWNSPWLVKGDTFLGRVKKKVIEKQFIRN